MEIDEGRCAIPANDVSQYYNHKLKEAVVQLQCELLDAATTYVDIYSIKYDLISHAKKYGFEQPLITCCGYGGKFNYDPNFLCSEKVKLHDIETIVGSCEDPSDRVNWDGIHYTQAANHWFFERIIDGSYSDPPIPLEMACHSEMEMTLLAQAN
ncbi:esterase-like [Coffea arabica]|uniref:Esterase-like n=1 Tax=Coffea arabica TaxID=13443 RepID=A0ABM4UEA2_COFAR